MNLNSMWSYLMIADFIILPILICSVALFAVCASIYFRIRPECRWKSFNPALTSAAMIVGFIIGWVIIYLLAQMGPATPHDNRTITQADILRSLLSTVILWGCVLGSAYLINGVRRGKNIVTREQP